MRVPCAVSVSVSVSVCVCLCLCLSVSASLCVRVCMWVLVCMYMYVCVSGWEGAQPESVAGSMLAGWGAHLPGVARLARAHVHEFGAHKLHDGEGWWQSGMFV